MKSPAEPDLLRAEITAFLRFEAPPNAPRTRIIRQTDENGYTRQLIEYDSRDGDTIAAFLLLPHGTGPFPGMVALHQHASRWTIGKSEVCGMDGDPYQAFGPALARRGVCVIAPDALGFESRLASSDTGKELEPKLGANLADSEHWLQYYNALSYRLVSGETLMRKMLQDAAMAVAVLASQASVDSSRLGVVGHSLGGQPCVVSWCAPTRSKVHLLQRGSVHVRPAHARWYRNRIFTGDSGIRGEIRH
jgi:dienelactone hydrolase